MHSPLASSNNEQYFSIDVAKEEENKFMDIWIKQKISQLDILQGLDFFLFYVTMVYFLSTSSIFANFVAEQEIAIKHINLANPQMRIRG